MTATGSDDDLPADDVVPGEPPGAVARLTFVAEDPEASVEFWKGQLGFRGDETGRLTFESPVAPWQLELVVERARPVERTFLDATGCVLVTLLTTRIEDDLASLRNAARASEIWEELVGGRKVRAAIVEAPGGELIELLQVHRA
jgi:catechol 2,3-dioxygenase-like lactoylglutathione lyase family enzyme